MKPFTRVPYMYNVDTSTEQVSAVYVLYCEVFFTSVDGTAVVCSFGPHELLWALTYTCALYIVINITVELDICS